MQASIEAASAGLEALSRRYMAVTHNLANASTTGYKRRGASFVQSLPQAGAGLTAEAASMGGLIKGVISVDFSQGSLAQTANPLDVALDGKGFLVIETPDGPCYTRSGMFRINQDRQLVDLAGRMVAGQSGPILVPTEASTSQITISADGEIFAAGASIGKLKIVDFKDTTVLVPVGASAFRAPKDVRPAAADDVSVRQGYQESSNVNIVEELVGLITVTRLYEANIKSIQTQDDRLKSILQVAMA